MFLQTKIRQSIEESLILLEQCHKLNGQFIGLASPVPGDFAKANLHQTTFFTSLIVTSLDSIPAAAALRLKAAGFIMKERSPQWSWNYWLRDCDDFRLRPYPDDLDDTACAMAALAAADGTMLTQDSLANFAKLLVSQESRPGGPYTTWLVNSSAKVVWKDIDIAVNANIGYFLKSQDIKLDGLENYTTEKINNNDLVSPYYLGEIPVIYFISRWYVGPASELLRKRIDGLLANYSELNDLQLSMLLTAALNLKTKLNIIFQIKYLLKRRTNQGWPAFAIYHEPAVKGIKYFAGSPELTTALACEALQKYMTSISPKLQPKTDMVNKSSIRIPKNKLLSDELELKYQNYLRDIISKDTKGQITRIATLTAQSLKIELDHGMLITFNIASLNGWASYTLFDDYLDGYQQPSNIPMAMLALRRAGTYFRRGLPDSQGFARYVDDALDIVDNANEWELNNCRLSEHDADISLIGLPEYKDLSQLANKSWGHTIASTGVLLAAGFPLDGQEQAELQRFYLFYLIARQLNDDAHDWEADLLNSQLSFVVTKLIKGYMESRHIERVCPPKELATIQTFFWENTISDIIKLVNQNLKLAKEALGNCRSIKDPTCFMSWLDDIQGATDKAADSKAKAEMFINSFTAK